MSKEAPAKINANKQHSTPGIFRIFQPRRVIWVYQQATASYMSNIYFLSTLSCFLVKMKYIKTN